MASRGVQPDFQSVLQAVFEIDRCMTAQRTDKSLGGAFLGEVDWRSELQELLEVGMRTFQTGANRDSDVGKLDYEGFFSPLVLERRAQYMHKNQKQAGKLRAPDNWQLGIPKAAYMASAFRHFMDCWKWHRGIACETTLEDALCALLFNVEGYLFELLKGE